jgi:hypothetical protein
MNMKKLLAERDALQKKSDRLREEYRKVAGELQRVVEKIGRMATHERLSPLIGIQSGVQVSFTRPPDDPQAWMNDAKGTLLDIRRTRGTVDYGERGEWDIPLDQIAPVGEPQGFTLQLFGSG